MKSCGLRNPGKRTILAGFIVLLFALSNDLSAQNWAREELKNRWGEVTGYEYIQLIPSVPSVAHDDNGDRDLTVGVFYIYKTTSYLRDTLVIGSLVLGGELGFHPAYKFVNESITLSLRNDGVTSRYQGFTVAKESDYEMVVMLVPSPELIAQLRTPGEWDVLIEGRNWYIRTTIRGNLPQ